MSSRLEEARAAAEAAEKRLSGTLEGDDIYVERLTELREREQAEHRFAEDRRPFSVKAAEWRNKKTQTQATTLHERIGGLR